jgi:signal transduction histidine kinase
LYKSITKLEFDTKEIMSNNSIELKSLNSQNKYIGIENRSDGIAINTFNSKNNLDDQTELFGYSNRAILGGYNNCFYDKHRNVTYTILFQDTSKYIFTEIPLNKEDDLTYTEILDHQSFHEINNKIITINNTKIYPPKIDEIFGIEEYLDGVRFNASQSLVNKVLKKVALVKEINYINNQLENKLTFSELELYLTNLMINLHYKKLFRSTNIENFGFLKANIIGFLDDSSPTPKELLIYVTGQRWIKSKLICFDLQSKSIKWMQEFNPDFYDIQVMDIDNDNINEILMSSFAHCTAQSPIQDSVSSRMGKNQSIFTILNNQGNHKLINGNKIIIKSEPKFHQWKFLFLKDKNLIILGLHSPFDNKTRKLKYFDLATSEIHDSNIEYNNLADIVKEKNSFSIININSDFIEQKFINSQLKEVNRITNKISTIPQSKSRTSKIMIQDNHFTVFESPLVIRDNKLNEVFVADNIAGFPHFEGNKLYFINKSNSYDEKLKQLTFISKYEINPWAILILSVEIIIILVASLFHFLLSVPFYSSNKSYLVLYSYFDKLFHWKIYGQLKEIYFLPKRFSQDNRDFESVLDEMTDDPTTIYEKNLWILKIKAYELQNWDILELIQEISHDLKNRALSIKMTSKRLNIMCEKNEQLSPISNISHTIDDDLAEISRISANLTQISRLNKLNFENVNIYDFMRMIVFSYNHHELYDNIVLHSCQKTLVKVDSQLLKSAITNLMNNALEEINPEQKVKIDFSQDKHYVTIKISNPGFLRPEEIKLIQKIGVTNKDSGSGLGIPASKMIIEKHGGALGINTDNESVNVSITLKKEYVYE